MWKNCINYCLTVRKSLGHPNTCSLLNQWNPLMEKKNMMLLTEEGREKNPPSPKQVPKTAPVARSNNSNVKKQPQAHNKGKGKAPATDLTTKGTEFQRFSRMPWEMYFRRPKQ
ncbi:hypothetical protein O181_094757 [Austropuccinia psidii MF-1]|uniref:Uncharacterized protein n=1 Tax=Austropuccinia psidii MF-1 TaxID=1389203 RepID=A0A9Q3J3I3_9BASI|nr:hypothetical protein [Austropuccinia psidii MF-1]